MQAMLGSSTRSSSFRPVLEEHLADSEEVLAHLLMAEIARAFAELVVADDQATIAVFLSQIERLASNTDLGVNSVVAVSFIENLWLGDPRERAAIEAVRPLFGPATAASVAITEAHYH